MKSQNLRVSRIRKRRKLYSSRRSKQEEPFNYFSNSSNEMTTGSAYDSSDELVCTNCVETDFYLAKFCNELLYSPSSAMRHLEGLINNPQFPKSDLSEMEHVQSLLSVSVPVTTSACIDCTPNERIPAKPKIEPFLQSQEDYCQTLSGSHFNYEKQRREMERDLINGIYELVCDQTVEGSQPTSRITKLHVSEMAIQRMENIQKINYNSQIERIKYKLLQSYRAFARLDCHVRQVDCHVRQVDRHRDLGSTVPYAQKIRDLEKSLHIQS